MFDEKRGLRFGEVRKAWGPRGEVTGKREWALFLGVSDVYNWERGNEPSGGVQRLATVYAPLRARGADPVALATWAFLGEGEMPRPGALAAQPEIRDPTRLPELAENAEDKGALVVVDFEEAVRRALTACERGEDPLPILRYVVNLVDSAPKASTSPAEPGRISAASSRSGGIGRRARFRVSAAKNRPAQQLVIRAPTVYNFPSSENRPQRRIISIYDTQPPARAVLKRA